MGAEALGNQTSPETLSQRYLVQRGDNLSVISRKFNGGKVMPEFINQVIALNGIQDINSIQIGQMLTIPIVSSTTHKQLEALRQEVPKRTSVQSLGPGVMPPTSRSRQRQATQEAAREAHRVRLGEAIRQGFDRIGNVFDTLFSTKAIIPPISENQYRQTLATAINQEGMIQTRIAPFNYNVRIREGFPGEGKDPGRVQERREANEIQCVGYITQAFYAYLQQHSMNGISTKQKQAFLAYILATADHESAGFNTMRERTNGKDYESNTATGEILGNKYPGDGYWFRGIGLVQLTGRYNIEERVTKTLFGEEYMASKQKYLVPSPRIANGEVGVPPKETLLAAYPEILAQPQVAALVLVYGMMDGGIFGNKRLKDFIFKENGEFDFHGARKIVNPKMNGVDEVESLAKNKYLPMLTGVIQ